MQAAINAFTHGFDNFLISTLVAGILLFSSCVIYILLTPMKELELLRRGNASAGLGLAGVIIGLAIPTASALAFSISIFDQIIWGVVALLLQLLAFRLVDLILKDLPKRIENDEAGAAILLIAVKISTALIVGAALWPATAPTPLP
jgi:putative membrane protein